jgi:hypothetical protein
MRRLPRRKQGMPCFAAWSNRGGAGGVANFRKRGVTSPLSETLDEWARTGARIHALRRHVAWMDQDAGMVWENPGSAAPSRSLVAESSFSSFFALLLSLGVGGGELEARRGSARCRGHPRPVVRSALCPRPSGGALRRHISSPDRVRLPWNFAKGGGARVGCIWADLRGQDVDAHGMHDGADP